MKPLLYPSYFPSISQFAIMAQATDFVLETEDNYQKQTNRTRAFIYSPNGIQLLNIPIKHSANVHQKTKDVLIENAFGWQRQHFKSLEAAYRSSPFFEYFEDAFQPIFNKKHTFLLDLNLETIKLISKCMQLKVNYSKTTEYFHTVTDFEDYRYLINGKKDTTVLTPYTQVFKEKHGYINNLSIVDLLFNEGRYALDYLKNQKI